MAILGVGVQALRPDGRSDHLGAAIQLSSELRRRTRSVCPASRPACAGRGHAPRCAGARRMAGRTRSGSGAPSHVDDLPASARASERSPDHLCLPPRATVGRGHRGPTPGRMGCRQPDRWHGVLGSGRTTGRRRPGEGGLGGLSRPAIDGHTWPSIDVVRYLRATRSLTPRARVM